MKTEIAPECMDKSPEIASGRLMQQCPRFNRCSVPICPLDLLQDRRDYVPGELKCRLPKARRLQIGQGTALERQGLTRKEWAAKQRWDNLSETERQAATERLTPVIGGELVKIKQG